MSNDLKQNLESIEFFEKEVNRMAGLHINKGMNPSMALGYAMELFLDYNNFGEC